VTGSPSPQVDVHYTDALSGINTTSLLVNIDGSPLTDCSVAAQAAACQTTALSSGSHTITALVDDRAGNRIATSSSFTLNLNGPPVLTPIGNKTAFLGQTLTFTVQATDPGGDPITLMVTPVPLPEHATFTGSTGVFTFHPTVNEVGAHVLTFSASDGMNQVSETITITVPAAQPTAPTTLEGVLLDANAAMNGSTVPIVGATVSLLGTGTSATSNAQGHFTINNAPAGKQVLDIAPGTGQPAPDGSFYGGFREAITLTGHVSNVVERPFFLPRIDAASVTPVNPNTTTTVTNPNLGVSITVPAHTAKNPDGTDFTGNLSISLVPRNLAPELRAVIERCLTKDPSQRQQTAREVELQERIMVGVILLEDFEDEISKDGAVGDVGVPVEETASGDPSRDEFERDHLDIARPEGDWVELLDEMGGHTIGVQ